MSHALPDTGQDGTDIVNSIKETSEHGEPAHPSHPAAGVGDKAFNRKAAILIAVLAAGLAILDTGAKNAQNEAIREQISATDQWGFYQAKTIRAEQFRVGAAILGEIEATGTGATGKQIEDWTRKAEKLDSDPSSGTGREQLLASAQAHEKKSEAALERHELLEKSVASLQIAIVLASASVVTAVRKLLWASIALAIAGVGLAASSFAHALS